MGKTQKKLKEWKPCQDENLKSYGSNPEGFQVHVVGYNEKGHKISARYGSGPETMFVDYANWNSYGPFTQEKLDSKAKQIHNSIRS